MAFNPRAAISTLAAGGGLLPTIGSLFSESGAGKASKKEYERQKEFAQNAIQWRVADAVAAGLHPLAALGMPVSSYSAQPVGGGDGGSLASEVSSMGQNVSSAMTANWRGTGVFEAAYQGLQLENAALQNDKLRAEIMVMTQPGRKLQGAGVFSPGGGKEDRLRSGGDVVVRDATGEAWVLPPGVDAQFIEDKLGEGGGDVVGAHSGMTAFFNRMIGKGIWPGVLGY